MTKKGIKKILLVVALLALFTTIYFSTYNKPTRGGVQLSPGSVITRTLGTTTPYTNENVQVTLTVTLNPTLDKVYSIEEALPVGTNVKDSGEGMYTPIIRKIRWIKYTAPLPTTETYTINFSSAGTYTLSGTYAFNNEPIGTTAGSTTIVVTACTPSPEICDLADNNCDHQTDEGCTDECNNNAGCGIDGWVDAPICNGDNVYQNYITFTCNNPTSSISTCSSSKVFTLNKTCTGTTPHCAAAKCVQCNDYQQCGVNGKNSQCSTGVCGCAISYAEDTTGNCCVDPSEVSTYVTKWLTDVGGVTRLQANGAAYNWITSVSACPPL